MNRDDFLPVNLDKGAREQQGRKLRLVLVDRELREELSRYSWKHQTRSNAVFRMVVDHDASDVASAQANAVKRVLTKLHLQTLLKGRESVTFKNGDVLDFRMDNMSVWPEGETPPAPTIVPGSTFDRTPEYAAALEWTQEHEAECQAASRSAQANYDHAATRMLLNYVEDNCADMHLPLVMTMVQKDLPELFDPKYYPNPPSIRGLQSIIRGRTCKVPGHNYEKLWATRPKAGRPSMHRDIFS